MKKNYVKMNNTDDQLSLGNLFRVIKDLAKNKSSALQSEIFCILFDLESIAIYSIPNINEINIEIINLNSFLFFIFVWQFDYHYGKEEKDCFPDWGWD